MNIGKNIRIFLSEGNVTGIRHAEVDNWTGQAIHCPRNKISMLAEWKEVFRPGVYLLFGIDEEDAVKQKVYVGEAENVLSRLQNHVSNKDFWDEVVVFTNKDKNLTKSHCKYLESRIVELANKIDRYRLENTTIPQPSTLPRGDVSSMEEFLLNIRLLLGILGHRLLEPISSKQSTSKLETRTIEPSTKDEEQQSLTELNIFFQTKEVDAKGLYTDEGVVVFEGSIASLIEHDSLSSSYKNLRENLIDENVLVENNEKLIFSQDHLFQSPSAAACVVSGYSINGRNCWKNKKGKSIKELESQSMQ